MQIPDKIWQQRAVRRGRGERGSALLIVLVFAAIVAIMLYRELPVAAFEAQRQKEELLVSRGNEYKHGIKLFVRKVGRFPNSIDELESTNRMRFLRHKYVDPLTGKEDWRIVHAGPGGVIIDSKIKTATTGAPGASTLGQGSTFKGFNNAFSGDIEAVAANATPPSAGMRQRPGATKNAVSANNDPLAMAATGGEASAEANAGIAGAPNPGTGQPGNTQANANDQLTAGNQSMDLNGNQANGPMAAGAGISSIAQQLNNVNPQTPEKAPSQQSPALGNTSVFGNANAVAGNAGNGQIGAAGGIAGVASVAPGNSIKTVNDQTKYKLWEFYYDLRKEQSAGIQNAMGGQQNQNGPGATNAGGIGGNSNNGISQSGQQMFGFGGTSPQQSSQPVAQPTLPQQLPQQQ